MNIGYLASAGYKLAILPGSVAMSAIAGMQELLRALKAEQTDRSHIAKVEDPEAVWRWYFLSEVDQIREAEERYLS